MLKKHVLVVDDSPTDRQIVTTLLQKQGYQVTTATFSSATSSCRR